MFTDLIQALANGSSHGMPELAEQLGTDAEGLRLAVEHSERLGYLERTDAV